jgi:hypothetical protein
LKEGASKQDSLAALVQKLAAGEDYMKILAAQGSDAADFWLTDLSLLKANAQAPGLMGPLHDKGWATDLVNFLDTETRYSDEDLKKPVADGQVALP